MLLAPWSQLNVDIWVALPRAGQLGMDEFQSKEMQPVGHVLR